MTVELVPAGGLFTTPTIGQPVVVQVLLPWEPNAEPRPIPPGALDALETCRRRIYWQWQQGQNWQALCAILGVAQSSIINEHFEIDQLRWLSTGPGFVLDEWGALVGLPRNGLGDAVYRQAIIARGASLIGDAGIDAVMRPIKILLGEGSASYVPQYPRGFCYLVTVAISTDLLELLVSLLRESVAGCGIGSKILLSPPEIPGWDWTTPQAWASSWSSAYGATDLATVAPWGYAVTIG